jgi:hypothetical protein
MMVLDRESQVQEAVPSLVPNGEFLACSAGYGSVSGSPLRVVLGDWATLSGIPREIAILQRCFGGSTMQPPARASGEGRGPLSLLPQGRRSGLHNSHSVYCLPFSSALFKPSTLMRKGMPDRDQHMFLVCPKCRERVEYLACPPRFCSFCGYALTAKESPTTIDHKPSCGSETPSSEAETLPPGVPGELTRDDFPETVGNYRLLRRVGTGAWARASKRPKSPLAAMSL